MPATKALFRAKLAMWLACILWASAFIGIRYAIKDYSPGAMALLRYLVASLCMGIIYANLRQRSKHRWKEVLAAMVLGVFGFAIYNVCLNAGEQHVDAGIASFIIGLSPLFVILIASWLYHERLNRFEKIGLVISVIGVIVIAVSEIKSFKIGEGMVLVLIACVSGAIYSAWQKKLLIKFHPIEFTAYAIWGGTFVMLIFMPHLWHEVRHAAIGSTLAIIYMGIFPGAIAYLCYSYAFTHMSASLGVSYSYSIPFIATLMGWIFLREMPNVGGMIGCVLALVGAIIVSREQLSHQK